MGLGFRRATSLHCSVLCSVVVSCVLCAVETEGEHVLPPNSLLGTKKSSRLGKKENISLPSGVTKKVLEVAAASASPLAYKMPCTHDKKHSQPLGGRVEHSWVSIPAAPQLGTAGAQTVLLRLVEETILSS